MINPMDIPPGNALALCMVALGLALSAGPGARASEAEVRPQTHTYKTVGDLTIKADIYRLPGDDVRPVIVWIHGGGLITGGRGGPLLGKHQRYLDAGYVIVSIDYRLAPETKLARILEDVQDAIRWVRTQGPELFKIDPQRVAVAGVSAGGYLTLMSGIAVEPRPQALIAICGYGDVDGDWYAQPHDIYRETRPLFTQAEAYHSIGSTETTNGGAKGRGNFYTYCRQNGLWPKEVVGFDPITQPREFDRFCPVRNVTGDYPPTLLVHGDLDIDVPYAQSVAMASELQRAGVAHEFITIQGGGHGLGGKGQDDPQVSAVYDRIESFLGAHTGDANRFFQPPPEYAGDFGDYRSPLKFYDGSEVKSAADWQRRRQEILGRWHGIMGPWPSLLAQPRIDYVKTEPRENFTQHHVRIEVAAGLMQPAILLVPNGEGPFPAAVVPYYEPETGAGLGKELRDFGYQLTKRGFVTLSIGGFNPRRDRSDEAQIQRLTLEAYGAANCHTALANMPNVDARRIGIVGHSYGGKWALFASCLYDKFACAAWSDGGVVFDERRANVNYWEPWYLGYDSGLTQQRQPGIPSENNPRTGAYQRLVQEGLDLHELHALMAPRPFLVSGGAEDQPERWRALNHAIAVNNLLGCQNRVAMTNRPGHAPTLESNAQIYEFFERFLSQNQ